MPDVNLLSDIFSSSEEDVGTFADMMTKVSGLAITELEEVRLKKTAHMQTETQKLITIMHGSHEDSYVWHIRPAHKKRPWAVPTKRVLYAVGKILNEYVPNDVVIDLHLPNSDWQIEEITVKANGALNHWAVTESSLGMVTSQFFEVLNTLV